MESIRLKGMISKRFWTDVAVVDTAEGHAITLDSRPVRTPGRLPLALPNRRLADAIADEWSAVKEEIDPRAMPLTGLANVAIERIAPDPAPFVAALAAYAQGDLLCYRADAPPALVARQAAAWDPLLDWARTRYDIHFSVATGIVHHPQPPATVARLSEAVAACGPFTLAALTPIVTVTGSLVAALALHEAAVDPDAVWTACRIDEDWQAEQWGEDTLATATTRAHRADYDAGVMLLRLIAEPISSACG